MSSVQEMRKAKQKKVVKYQELVLKKEELLKDGVEVVFYLEGKDDIKYYRSRFEEFLEGKKYTHFYVEGKKNVLELKEFFDKKIIEEFKIRFIVDKDYDEIEKQEKLYITPTYSIENLYILKESFEKILETYFSLNKYDDEDKDDYDKILKLYSKRKNEYLDAIEDVVKWYYFQKNNKVEVKKLKEITKESNELVVVNLNGIEKKYNLKKLKELTPEYIEIEESELKKIFILKKEERKLYFRGKYLLEFLEKFIKILVQDVNQKTPIYFSKKRKTSLNISGDVLGSLTNCSKTPDCLKYFLKTIN